MDYLPISDEKWPHSRGNVGKYFLHSHIVSSGKSWHRNKIKKQSGSVVPSHKSNQEMLALLFSSASHHARCAKHGRFLEVLQPRKRSEGKKGEGPNSMVTMGVFW